MIMKQNKLPTLFVLRKVPDVTQKAIYFRGQE